VLIKAYKISETAEVIKMNCLRL